MNERLIPVASFYLNGQADADGVSGVYVPADVVITDVSHFLTFAGGSTAATIDIQDDGTDVQAAISVDANGLTALTAPGYSIASGSVIEIDLNITGGTTPTATGEVVIWGFIG